MWGLLASYRTIHEFFNLWVKLCRFGPRLGFVCRQALLTAIANDVRVGRPERGGVFRRSEITRGLDDIVLAFDIIPPIVALPHFTVDADDDGFGGISGEAFRSTSTRLVVVIHEAFRRVEDTVNCVGLLPEEPIADMLIGLREDRVDDGPSVPVRAGQDVVLSGARPFP